MSAINNNRGLYPIKNDSGYGVIFLLVVIDTLTTSTTHSFHYIVLISKELGYIMINDYV